MKRIKIAFSLFVVGALLVLAGCDQLVSLSDAERLDAFLESANASPRDYDEMQSHFSESAPSYSSMNTSGFWDPTVFRVADQQFTVTGRTSGGEVSGYSGSTSISGTFTSTIVSGGEPITFVFVSDTAIIGNRVLAAIEYNDGGQVIKNLVDD